MSQLLEPVYVTFAALWSLSLVAILAIVFSFIAASLPHRKPQKTA